MLQRSLIPQTFTVYNISVIRKLSFAFSIVIFELPVDVQECVKPIFFGGAFYRDRLTCILFYICNIYLYTSIVTCFDGTLRCLYIYTAKSHIRCTTQDARRKTQIISDNCYIAIWEFRWCWCWCACQRPTAHGPRSTV